MLGSIIMENSFHSITLLFSLEEPIAATVDRLQQVVKAVSTVHDLVAQCVLGRSNVLVGKGLTFNNTYKKSN